MRERRHWIPAEDAIISRPGITLKQILLELPHRTGQAVYYRRQALGVAASRGKRLLWTDDEDRILRQLVPDYAAAVRALPHRTLQAVKARARALGLQRHREPWTGRARGELVADAATLADAELATRYRTSPKVVQRIRLELGAKRGNPMNEAADVPPLVADIRRRCKDVGVSLSAIARLVGHPGLLTPTVIRIHGPAQADLAAAVAVLGGEIYAEWENL